MVTHIPPNTDWASIVFIRVIKEVEQRKECVGFVFVREMNRPNVQLDYKPQWKFAGGRKNPAQDKTPAQTAKREVREETGIASNEVDFKFIDSWWHDIPMERAPGKRERSPHHKILFSLDITERERDWINSSHPLNGFEEPRFFASEAIPRLVADDDIKPDHLALMYKWNLIDTLHRKTLI